MFRWAAIAYASPRFDATLHNDARSWAKRCKFDPAIFALGITQDEAIEEMRAMDDSFQALVRNESGCINLGAGCGDVRIRLHGDVLVVSTGQEPFAPPPFRHGIARDHAAALGLALEKDRGLPLQGEDELYRCHAAHVEWAPYICTAGYVPAQIMDAINAVRSGATSAAPLKRKKEAANDSGQIDLFGVTG